MALREAFDEPIVVELASGSGTALATKPTTTGRTASAPTRPRRAKATSTSRFGAAGRESHDASEFYARFTPPVISDDDYVARGPELDPPLLARLGDGCLIGDSRSMPELPDACVALVVTSPPYFVGKEYEDALAADADERIPNSYLDYLKMLREVVSECVRVLEPGGRIAFNVANLGRKPYRSLAADVVRIFEDLGLLLRGEIVWHKSKGSSGSCAWGSFRSPTNPTLRDTTERIVIASKGRFDRAVPTAKRAKLGLPHRSTLTTDEFMEATLDVWEIGAESARRVHHPAPFPLELPRRLIDLYTFEGDLVLDPFMGSGTTLVASALSGRKGVGYDLDPKYVALARSRVEQVVAPAGDGVDNAVGDGAAVRKAVAREATVHDSMSADSFVRAAVEAGRRAHDIAAELLVDAGFEVLRSPAKCPGTGVEFSFLLGDQAGTEWWADLAGAFTTVRPGLLRSDVMWKSIGRAAVLAAAEPGARLLLLTPHLPKRNGKGAHALRTLGPAIVSDVVELFDELDLVRLAKYAAGEAAPIEGFWSRQEILAVL